MYVPNVTCRSSYRLFHSSQRRKRMLIDEFNQAMKHSRLFFRMQRFLCFLFMIVRLLYIRMVCSFSLSTFVHNVFLFICSVDKKHCWEGKCRQKILFSYFNLWVSIFEWRFILNRLVGLHILKTFRIHCEKCNELKSIARACTNRDVIKCGAVRLCHCASE